MKKVIGVVGVDSGQLVICDPCYIDNYWEKEDFQDIRIYKHRNTKEQLQFRKDFMHYDELIPEYSKTMNQLNETGEWEAVESPSAEKPFSYNACCKLTLSKENAGQLNYPSGHKGIGVAFCSGYGDGEYPVYAHYDKNGKIIKIEIIF